MSEPQTADLALMRELNERIVLNLIRQDGPILRAALERELGLRCSSKTVPMTASAAQGIIPESMPFKEQLKGGGS